MRSNLYEIQDNVDRMFVFANTMHDAIDRWREHIGSNRTPLGVRYISDEVPFLFPNAKEDSFEGQYPHNHPISSD
jgi:hypothetical protein